MSSYEQQLASMEAAADNEDAKKAAAKRRAAAEEAGIVERAPEDAKPKSKRQTTRG